MLNPNEPLADARCSEAARIATANAHPTRNRFMSTFLSLFRKSRPRSPREKLSTGHFYYSPCQRGKTGKDEGSGKFSGWRLAFRRRRKESGEKRVMLSSCSRVTTRAGAAIGTMPASLERKPLRG